MSILHEKWGKNYSFTPINLSVNTLNNLVYTNERTTAKTMAIIIVALSNKLIIDSQRRLVFNPAMPNFIDITASGMPNDQ